MSEQIDRDSGDDMPRWNSWAWGIMLDLTVLILAFCGMSRVLSLWSDWAHVAQDFDHACQGREQLTSELQSRVDENAYWRACNPRLAGHPHPYPVPELILTGAEQPQRLSPHIPGPKRLVDLLQQPIPLSEQQSTPYHYSCRQSVAPVQTA